MSNQPPLFTNILDSLEDESKKVFLWALERPSLKKMSYDEMLLEAEKFTWEVEKLQNIVGPLIDMSSKTLSDMSSHKLTHEQRSYLLKFIMTRHANFRFGGNISPSYLG